jgi:predicted metal-dependent hydrolase
MELQSWEDERDAQDEHHALHLFAARVTFSQTFAQWSSTRAQPTPLFNIMSLLINGGETTYTSREANITVYNTIEQCGTDSMV